MTATVPCSRCRRPIREGSDYFTRRLGPRCGGRIRRTRKPATHTTPTAPSVGAALDVLTGQLALDLEAVSS